jgi:hypothetical protein
MVVTLHRRSRHFRPFREVELQAGRLHQGFVGLALESF